MKKSKISPQIIGLVFMVVMVSLLGIALIASQQTQENRSRAAHPPTNPPPTNTPPAGPTNTPSAPTVTPGGPTVTPGGPTVTPGGPTVTPGGPTITVPPSACVIQGFKVVMPGNQNREPAKSQSICNDDPSHCTNAQPYSFVTTPGNHTVSFVVPPNFGYTVSSSLCYNSISCHDLAQPTPGVIVSGASRAVVCPASGYADLWWHIDRDPTVCPRHKEGDANCDGTIDGVDYSIWLNTQCYPETAAGETCKDYRADFNDDGKVYDDDYKSWFTCRRTTPQCKP